MSAATSSPAPGHPAENASPPLDEPARTPPHRRPNTNDRRAKPSKLKLPILSGAVEHTSGEQKQPLLVQNPDGSIARSLPPGWREKSPKRSPRIGFSASGLLWGELEETALTEELDLLYARHEKLFVILLFLELLVEGLYLTLFWCSWQQTVAELETVYGHARKSSLGTTLGVAFGLRAVYSLVYYLLALEAVRRAQSPVFKLFASWSLLLKKGIGREEDEAAEPIDGYL
eukprot:CAMPEP_0179007756 /NCGR_PEP_ID=MMETSP0795-20121207/15337_1 /TAXON_ID=88552 /ORGANISM="Amoebophrya sp., Strain Ameob2" /LENGTH=229 /DNA_ID=CAMNT_0020702765 /DNA_START=43 /DNA_END=732 /DNA_ORIENTATION=-